MKIPTKKEVKELGMVFTPTKIVKRMCDLIPKDIWDDITKTFLEPTCVDCLTEFWNGKNWKPISQYNENDYVLVFDGVGSKLEKPLNYIKVKSNENLYTFEGKKLNMSLSKEHRVLFYDRLNKVKLKELTAEQVFEKYYKDSNHFLLSFFI